MCWVNPCLRRGWKINKLETPFADVIPRIAFIGFLPASHISMAAAVPLALTTSCACLFLTASVPIAASSELTWANEICGIMVLGMELGGLYPFQATITAGE